MNRNKKIYLKAGYSLWQLDDLDLAEASLSENFCREVVNTNARM